jgi:hypothetical protein
MWAEDAGCRETINAAELDLQRSYAAVSDVSSAQIRLEALCSLPALAGRAADPHRPHPCDDDRRLAVAVDLANLPLLPTTSFLAFVFIVLIICMLAFRIFAESCQSRATSSWNCPRIQSKLAHCPTVVGGFIQRTLEASKCASMALRKAGLVT